MLSVCSQTKSLTILGITHIDMDLEVKGWRSRFVSRSLNIAVYNKALL